MPLVVERVALLRHVELFAQTPGRVLAGIARVLEETEFVGTAADAPVGLCFMPAGPTRKTVKNRVHMDLTTTAEDRDSEIARLIALGARPVNVGQTGRESWDVLGDPEGNEFCVVRPKTTLVE